MFTADTLKYPGFYRGKVLDNNDSDKLGRLKVQIFGIFDGIASEDLPWAVPAFPLSVGAGIGFGLFTISEVDSYVWCFFKAGDYNQPVYFAEASDGVHGLPSERLIDYPNTHVLKTKNGIVISINDKSESQDITITHPGGASVVIDNGGNIIITGNTIQLNP